MHLLGYSHVYIHLHLMSMLRTSGPVPPRPDIFYVMCRGKFYLYYYLL